ncbi:MAG: glycerol-3-phosphate cytidylyltransferase [Parcubacteria group bacterium Gr01-1014_29]|nr:MAG: glycerol-3-phosphate cytidylyltransferase [Parcubacteria group bacterium Gr01-1014_29]
MAQGTTHVSKRVVVVSGGFDPLHVGHVRMFEEARKLGDRLVVILNNDNWLRKKKGFVFMPQRERKELIKAFASVDEVVLTKHSRNPKDMSVCQALESLRPDIFANGGDRTVQDAANQTSSLNADVELCKKLGVTIMYNVGRGGKVQSSSWLLAAFRDNAPCFCGSGKKFKRCHGQ